MVSFSACTGDSDDDWALGVGDPCPDFSVVDNAGVTVDRQAIAGRGAVIVFFDTSCPDCQRELPGLEAEYRQMILDHSEMIFLCISREEDAESVARYWRAHGFTMPYSAQTTRDVFSLFARQGIPRVYHISPDLIITFAH